MNNCQATCTFPCLHRGLIIFMALKESERIKYQCYPMDKLKNDVQSNEIMAWSLNGQRCVNMCLSGDHLYTWHNIQT